MANFLFFEDNMDNYPEKDRVLISSTKQAIETSLLLITFCRYPHAAFTLCEALEKILNAGIHTRKTSDDSRGNFQFLIDEFCKINRAAKIQQNIHKFRKFRNKVAHRGLSPEFDEEALTLYLSTGFYALEIAFKEFFNMELLSYANRDTSMNRQKLDGSPAMIYYIVSEMLRYTKKISRRQNCLKDLTLAYWPLVLTLRQLLKRNFISDIESDLIENGDLVFDVWHRNYGDYRDPDDEPALFSCPICFAGTMNVAISYKTLDENKLVISKATCTQCLFIVDEYGFNMHIDLFTENLLEIRDNFFKECAQELP